MIKRILTLLLFVAVLIPLAKADGPNNHRLKFGEPIASNVNPCNTGGNQTTLVIPILFGENSNQGNSYSLQRLSFDMEVRGCDSDILCIFSNNLQNFSHYQIGDFVHFEWQQTPYFIMENNDVLCYIVVPECHAGSGDKGLDFEMISASARINGVEQNLYFGNTSLNLPGCNGSKCDPGAGPTVVVEDPEVILSTMEEVFFLTWSDPGVTTTHLLFVDGYISGNINVLDVQAGDVFNGVSPSPTIVWNGDNYFSLYWEDPTGNNSIDLEDGDRLLEIKVPTRRACGLINFCDVSIFDDACVIIPIDVCPQKYCASIIRRDFERDGPREKRQANTSQESGFEVVQSYPNPFYSSTTLHIQSTLEQSVEIRIYDMKGQLMESIDRILLKGRNDIDLQGENWPNGTYIYQVQSESGEVSGEMTKID